MYVYGFREIVCVIELDQEREMCVVELSEDRERERKRERERESDPPPPHGGESSSPLSTVRVKSCDICPLARKQW